MIKVDCCENNGSPLTLHGVEKRFSCTMYIESSKDIAMKIAS
jgi:hypothetical protein